MKNKYRICWTSGLVVCFALGLLSLLGAGCASNNVNPAKPRAHTGYLDLFTDATNLMWQVDELDSAGKRHQLFAEFNSVQDQVLRLAFKPGNHQIRVSFLNCVITQPGITNVEITEGMITPIRVTLVEDGTTFVETKQVRIGGTYFGRYGRGTRFRENEVPTFKINLQPEIPLAYKPKKGITYASPPSP